MAKYFRLEIDDIRGASRQKEINRARQIAMYLMAEEGGMPMKKVADEVGRDDHTTALHGVRKIKTIYSTDFVLREQIMNIKSRIFA